MVDENKSTDNQELEETPSAEGSAFSEKAISTISGLRTRAQSAELALAEMKGRNAVLENVQSKAAPPPKSPLELRAERDGCNIDEVQMDGALYQAQQRHDRQVANAKTAQDNNVAAVEVQEKSIAAARVKHEDWEEIVRIGQGQLTAGELLDIQNAGADYATQAYAKCKTAIERAKPKTDSSAPEKKSSEPEKKAETGKPEPPTQQEILDTVGAVDADTEAAMKL